MKTSSEMTYTVSGGALNSAQSIQSNLQQSSSTKVPALSASQLSRFNKHRETREVLQVYEYEDTRDTLTYLYGVVSFGRSSSMIGGRDEISLTGSGSASSRPSSPNHCMH